MAGFNGFEDMIKDQMGQVRVLCYQYTGNRFTAQAKYVMTYIFHYLPEKFFLFFMFILMVVLFKWCNNFVWYFKAVDVLGFLYTGLKYPSEIWLSYFCKKGEDYESVVAKMWRSPVIPYNVILKYMQFNGHTCPSPE